MYSFQSIHEDPQALDDMVAEQATSLNALQQQFDLLKQDADHFRSVSTEQQAQIDQMRQQVGLQFHATQAAFHMYLQLVKSAFKHFCPEWLIIVSH